MNYIIFNIAFSLVFTILTILSKGGFSYVDAFILIVLSLLISYVVRSNDVLKLQIHNMKVDKAYEVYYHELQHISDSLILSKEQQEEKKELARLTINEKLKILERQKPKTFLIEDMCCLHV